MNDETNQQVRCWAVIPAAGTSQRMGTGLPKQYLSLLSKTVIESSLECFLQHPQIIGVFVVLHINDQYWQKLPISKHNKIETVIGGETRALSVKNALDKAKDYVGVNDFVLVHDAARPCLSYSDLDFLINTLIKDEVGGILASPLHDTIKISENNIDGLIVKKTLDRNLIWKAYTPQMFRIEKLNQALEYCFLNHIEVTDEASAIEALGLKVRLIQGRDDNIKITHKDDLKHATFILQQAKDHS